jgi:hypothetical protein
VKYLSFLAKKTNLALVPQVHSLTVSLHDSKVQELDLLKTHRSWQAHLLGKYYHLGIPFLEGLKSALCTVVSSNPLTQW